MDKRDLGDALHTILAAELLNPGHPGRFDMAGRVLRGYGLDGYIRADDVLDTAARFAGKIGKLFSPKTMLIETPFQMWNADGQISSGFIELALETGEGWVIIDHKTFQGTGVLLELKV